MGDRTSVDVLIREIDYEWLLRAEFKDDEASLKSYIGANEIHSSYDYVSLHAYENNGGYWDDLQELLAKHSVEYNLDWGRGYEYGPGSAYGRRVGNEFLVLEIGQDENALIDFLEELRQLKDPRGAIEAKYRELVPFEITPI